MEHDRPPTQSSEALTRNSFTTLRMLAILLMNVFAPVIDHYVIQANVKRRVKRKNLSMNKQINTAV